MSSSESFIVWEPEPNRRGTFGIIVTCFTTLGICVWSSLHLNIPKERPTWRQNIVRGIVWSLIGMLVPELLISIAFHQYLSAREIRGKVNEKLGFGCKQTRRRPMLNSEDSRQGEGRIQDLSGLLLKLRGGRPGIHAIGTQDLALGEHLTSQKTTARKCVHRWTLIHGFYAVMGGFVCQSHDDSGNITRAVIPSHELIQLLEEHSDLIPGISQDVIRNKGKSDSLAKLILIMQVSWFCINCIGRLAQHLPLTLLEVSTVAHAACSLFVYTLWWYKPLNVADPTHISYPGAHLCVRLEGLWDTENDSCTEDVAKKTCLILGAVFMMVGVVYGGPHFLAWNSSFATHTEQLLWRICTCAVVGTPIFCGIFFIISDWAGVSVFAERLSLMGIILSTLIYFPANLYLVAASLRQLFHLPPASFILPVWSSYFPHVS